MRSRADRHAVRAAAVAVFVVGAAAACRDDDPATSIQPGDARPADARAWCTLAAHRSMPLSAPSAEGPELVLLDMDLVRWRALPADTDGVPNEAIGAAKQIEITYMSMRDRMATGDERVDVAADAYADLISGDAADTVDRTIDEFCPANPFDEPG